jgi:hypothetical protein
VYQIVNTQEQLQQAVTDFDQAMRARWCSLALSYYPPPSNNIKFHFSFGC